MFGSFDSIIQLSGIYPENNPKMRTKLLPQWCPHGRRTEISQNVQESKNGLVNHYNAFIKKEYYTAT